MIRIKNAGAKIAGAIIAMGLTAGAAFAEVGYTLNVTLPETVNVGGVSLPSGSYKVDELRMGGSDSTLVFYDNSGTAAAAVTATKTASTTKQNADPEGYSRKTEFILSHAEDGTTHLKSLYIDDGQQTGYRFLNPRS